MRHEAHSSCVHTVAQIVSSVLKWSDSSVILLVYCELFWHSVSASGQQGLSPSVCLSVSCSLEAFEVNRWSLVVSWSCANVVREGGTGDLAAVDVVLFGLECAQLGVAGGVWSRGHRCLS